MLALAPVPPLVQLFDEPVPPAPALELAFVGMGEAEPAPAIGALPTLPPAPPVLLVPSWHVQVLAGAPVPVVVAIPCVSEE